MNAHANKTCSDPPTLTSMKTHRSPAPGGKTDVATGTPYFYHVADSE